jgi:hypothetical protein
MPDEEEARLLAALTECHWLSLAASAALKRPIHSVVNGSNAHRKLAETDAAARAACNAARLALREYRGKSKEKAQGAGGSN